MAQLLGVKVQRGLSKAGKDYNIVTATYVSSAEDVDKENLKIKNYGLNVSIRQFAFMEKEQVDSLVTRLSTRKFPCEVQLITEEREFNGKFESALVDIKFNDKE